VARPRRGGRHEASERTALFRALEAALHADGRFSTGRHFMALIGGG
jgi:hypothetical protein